MDKLTNILDGTKILAITDGNGKQRNFIGSVEKEKVSLKMIYYLWLSRLFIVIASASLLIFVASSLALFKLAPQVTVEPFLIIRQNSSDEIVRYEPIDYNMAPASKEMMMETFVRQYVTYRNSVVSDEREMMVRWYPGGLLNYLSAPLVFDEFSEYREKVWRDMIGNASSREIEIISVNKVGGKTSPVWKVDFKTYDVSEKKRNNETGGLILTVRYWTASVTAFFIPGREFYGRRLINPLGFTVTRYSQSEVDFI